MASPPTTSSLPPCAWRRCWNCEKLYAALDGLIAALEEKGKEFHHILKSGRTHMMDAVPMRLGQEFTAYAGAIRRAKQAIQQQAELLREVGLGGSAVGTGINTHPDYREKAVAKLARISGQKLTPVDDMRYAMQSNLAMSSVSSALRNLALEVIRISNDLRLLSSGPNTGLAEINLPALQPGSSIMPGKINPVMAELAAMVSFQVVGYDTAVALAVQAGQLELNVMMPTMAYSVLTSITIMTNMLRQFTEFCIKGITANEKRCEFYVQSTVSLATALNPYIGYAKAAEIAKESVATGKTIIEIARSKGYLSEEQIKEILDPGAHDGTAAAAGRGEGPREDLRCGRSRVESRVSQLYLYIEVFMLAIRFPSPLKSVSEKLAEAHGSRTLYAREASKQSSLGGS